MASKISWFCNPMLTILPGVLGGEFLARDRVRGVRQTVGDFG
jgi:hypothetical protein